MTKLNTNNENFWLLAILHALTFFTGFWLVWIILYYVLQKDKLSNDEIEATKNTINFHISFFIYFIISWILTVILIWILWIIVFWFAYIIFWIIVFFKLLNWEIYQFPWTIQLLK